MLAEIVVTAQRRSQSLEDIGIAINAFTGDQMKDLGAKNVGDLALLAPGLHMTETGVTGVPVYTIRGVGFDDYSANSSSTVGIYQDEVSLPYPTMTRGPQFDLERVEILKGPQGTLYGRNTTGGAINLISARPTEDFVAGLTLGYSRFETFDVEGYVSGPVSDTVRARLAATTTQSNTGWQRSSSRPGDTLGEQDKLAARLMVEVDASESLTVLLNAHGYRDKSDNPAPQYFAYVPLVPDLAPFFPAPPADDLPDLSDPRSADWSATLRPVRDNKGGGVSATLTWDWGDLTLTSITAYERMDRDETNDWDGTSHENLDVILDTTIDAYSQELRLSSDAGGDVTWLLGGYLSHDKVRDSWIALGSEATNYQGVFGAVDTRYEQKTDTAALFGHTEWQMAEQWRWTLGLRYTHEKRKWSGCSYDVDGGLAFLYSQYDLGPIPGFADHFYLSSTPLQPGSCATIDTSQASYTVDPVTGEVSAFGGASGLFTDAQGYDNLSGKIGLDWTPREDMLVYASISRGFKSGGYNGAAASTQGQLAPYSAEKLTAYELGMKTSLLDQSMRLNASLFRYDYRDKQILGFVADDVFGVLTQIVNVPKSVIHGAETEVEWQATEALYLRLGVAWLDSEVKKYVGLNGFGVVEDYKGRDLAQSAEWQVNGLTEYRWPVGNALSARVGADFTYSDSYQSAIDPSPLFYVDDYFVWNARAGIGAEDGRWEVLLWGRNMSNKTYYTSANVSNDYWYRTPGRGFVWGATLNLAW